MQQNIQGIQDWLKLSYAYLEGYVFAASTSETIWFSAIVAAISAFAGAMGAQVISSRSAKRKAIEDTISILNRAVFLSHSVRGSFLAVKDQQINDLHGNYMLARRAFEFARKNPTGGVYTVNFHLETMPSVATESKEIVRALLSLDVALPQPLVMATLLQSAIDDFLGYNSQRNEWIKEFREFKASDEEKAKLYFGFRVNGNMQDNTYYSLVNALKDKCDDAIAFSHLLSEQLSEQSWSFRRSHYWRFQKPKVGAPVISLKKDYLLPDMQQYNEFLEKAVLPKKKFWESWEAYKLRVGEAAAATKK